MTRKQQPQPGGKQATPREQRLKAALKANLARRKAQTRAGSAGKPGETGETGKSEG